MSSATREIQEQVSKRAELQIVTLHAGTGDRLRRTTRDPPVAPRQPDLRQQLTDTAGFDHTFGVAFAHPRVLTQPGRGGR